jgi:hypothetical protein
MLSGPPQPTARRALCAANRYLRLVALLCTPLGLLLLPLRALAHDATEDPSQIASLFAHGKANQAIQHLSALVRATSDPSQKVTLLRDLLDMCMTAHDYECASGAIDDMARLVQSDRQLSSRWPPFAAAAVKLAIFYRDFETLRQLLANGPFAIADPFASAYSLADLQTTLAGHYVRNHDPIKAEEALSSATLELLLGDPQSAGQISKQLVGLVRVMISKQDTVGALSLLMQAEPYISRSLPHDGIQYAEYRLVLAHILSFTTAYREAADVYEDVRDLYRQLDMNDDEKLYEMSAANILQSLALLLAGETDRARQVHLDHPLEKLKPSILARASFSTLTEFSYGVTDVLLSSINGMSDIRWKPLFEQEPSWTLDADESLSVRSYRNFALGLLTLTYDAERGKHLLILAADQQIDSFELSLKNNVEGFPLPSMIDRIVIGAGTEVALGRSADGDAAELILRASEVLNRTIRHSLGDAAVLVGSQSTEEGKRNVQSYIHLLMYKRDWENKRIKQYLEGRITLQDRGEIIRQYSELVGQLSALKPLFHSDLPRLRAEGFPKIATLQSTLKDQQVLVTVFPTIAGLGKLCVGRNRIAFALQQYGPDLSLHVRLMNLALTSSHVPSDVLDSQFPVDSAIYLRQLMFGGLESCLAPGSSVILSLPALLSGIPRALFSPKDLRKQRTDMIFVLQTGLSSHSASRPSSPHVKSWLPNRRGADCTHFLLGNRRSDYRPTQAGRAGSAKRVPTRPAGRRRHDRT